MPENSHNIIARWHSADGCPLQLRTLCEDDTPSVKQALNRLSSETRYNRFFSVIGEFSDELVYPLTHFDSRRHYAVLVTHEENGAEIPIAGGRIVQSGEDRRCEFSIVIDDAWQGLGIGHRIMAALIDEAVRRGMQGIFGYVLAENRKMMQLAHAHGFTIHEKDEEPGVRLMEIDLSFTMPRRAGD